MRSEPIRRVASAVRRRLGIPNAWVERQFLGRSLVVRDGTFQPEPDYDDAWLHACASHAKIVFDVGANVGQSAMLMLIAGSERVVLVDANWQALAIAAENLIRNQMSAPCSFVRAFAGERGDATVDFWTVGTGAAGSMYQSHAQTAARAGSMSTVPTTTLDDLAARFGLVPDLIKIDVEGAEHKVLLGATKIAAHKQTRWLIEMHRVAELPMAANVDLVLEWARTTGYAVWYLATGARLTDTQPLAHRGRCHVLVQPADWPFPDWLAGIPQSAPLPR